MAGTLAEESGFLLLPIGGGAANKLNSGLDIKRTATHPLEKVFLFECPEMRVRNAI